jgi:hypothetical protein
MNMQVQPAVVSVTALQTMPIPRDLQVGDVVRIRGTKDVGIIVEEHCRSYEVRMFGSASDEEVASDLLEMWTPAPRRLFKSGEVRIIGTRFNGRIGYLLVDNGNEEEDRPYLVSMYGGDYGVSEEFFSASELSPWVPKVGDWVRELHSGGCEVGIILANDGTTSHVEWKTWKDAPYWPNIRLEPAM